MDDPDVLHQLCFPLSSHIGESVQDSPLLRVLLDLVYFQLLPKVCHCLRFYEQCGACGRLLHNAARNHGPALFLHRDTESSVSGDYKGVVQILSVGFQCPLCPLTYFFLQDLNLFFDIF